MRVAMSRRAVMGLVWYPTVALAADSPPVRLTVPALRDNEKRLYLVRHGETDFNVQNRIQGRTDNPLNENGRRQASAVAQFLAGAPLGIVASSDLMRASNTADAIHGLHPSAARMADERFEEICFGDLEGAVLEGASLAQYEGIRRSWKTDPAVRLPGKNGESPELVASRGLAGLRSLGLLPGNEVASSVAAPRHVCIVAHGRFNKILIAALQGDVRKCNDVAQGNTCVNVLDIAADGGVDVRALDLRDHLRPIPAFAGSQA